MHFDRPWILLLVVLLSGCGGEAGAVARAASNGGSGNRSHLDAGSLDSGNRSPIDAGSGESGNGNPIDPGRDGSASDAALPPRCAPTGYDGDDLCMAPPAHGIQLHYGPATYAAADIAPFLLQPNEEITECLYVDAPNDADLEFDEFHIRMRGGGSAPGAPWLLAMANPATTNQPGIRSCFGYSSPVYFSSYGSSFDVPDPNVAVSENTGLAMRLPAHQPMTLEFHFRNDTDKPLLREAWINIVSKDPATVTARMGSVALFNLGTNVPAHTTGTAQAEATAPQDLRLVSFYPYFGEHTRRFAASKVSGGTSTLLLETYALSPVPQETYFDGAHKNPVPDPAAKHPGAFSGPVELAAGDQITWECEIENDLDAAITFGSATHTQEICGLFGFFAPSDGTSWVGASW
jgi:hypothetical protein